MAETDLQLLQRYVRLDDVEAFNQIVQRYGRFVYNTGLRVVGDAARAEDICQETFCRLMRGPEAVQHSLGGWLHRTATRLAIDAVRSEQARRRRESWFARERSAGAGQGWEALSAEVDGALDRLPGTQRELLVEHFLLGKSQRQIASELGVSNATVSRQLNRALRELRKQMGRRGYSVDLVLLPALFAQLGGASVSAQLAGELGKLTLLSGSTITSGTATATLGVKAKLLALAGVILAAGCLTLPALYRLTHTEVTITPAPAATERRQVLEQSVRGSDAFPEENEPGPLDKAVGDWEGEGGFVTIPASEVFDSREIMLVERVVDLDRVERLNVVHGDNSVRLRDVEEVRERVRQQTGRSLKSLYGGSGGTGPGPPKRGGS